MFIHFQNLFTVGFSSKFAVSRLKIPPHLNYVAKLPYEISMFKNRHALGVSAAKCRVRLRR